MIKKKDNENNILTIIIIGLSITLIIFYSINYYKTEFQTWSDDMCKKVGQNNSIDYNYNIAVQCNDNKIYHITCSTYNNIDKWGNKKAFSYTKTCNPQCYYDPIDNKQICY